MKKMALRIVATILLLATMGTLFVGCYETEEKLPDDKTILYVSNYYGGLGDEWLNKAIARFEADYADYELNGKKGVKVKVNNNQNIGTSVVSSIKTSPFEVYILESVYYYDFVNAGVLADITDVVTSPLTLVGETGTIEDKMYDVTKDYLKTENGKYYAIPWYEAYSGLTYDVDMFNRYNFYFASNGKDGAAAYTMQGSKKVFTFVSSADAPKSYGPDGKTGVINGIDYSADDGLPATYEQFYALCERMKSVGVTPMLWTSLVDYVGYFLTQLMADYEGLDNMMLNFEVLGEAEHIVESFKNGDPQIVEKILEAKNGAELYKQAGRYYALEFLYTMITNEYVSRLSYASSEGHLTAQSDFIYGTYVEDTGKEKIGMFVESTWWEHEARGTFEAMAEARGEAAKRENRNFAYMPLPKVDDSHIGEKQTRVTQNNTAMFINGNVSEDKLPLCKDFLRYLVADVTLADFIACTSTPMLYDYKLTDEQYSNLTNFGKSVMDFHNTADIAYPNSKSEIWLSNSSFFDMQYNFWGSMVDGIPYTYPTYAFKDKGVTPQQYFEGIYAQYQSSWDRTFADFIN